LLPRPELLRPVPPALVLLERLELLPSQVLVMPGPLELPPLEPGRRQLVL
jgi:hypothetical protein